MGNLTEVLSLEAIAFKVANAFLRQRYPLTECGQELRNEIQALVTAGRMPVVYLDLLPTVENPRPELFKSFNLPMAELSKILGWGLQVVQTSKGCTHHCKHCFLDSSRQVSMMPYPALFKIAQVKRAIDEFAVMSHREMKRALIDKGAIADDFDIEKFFDGASIEDLNQLTTLANEDWKGRCEIAWPHSLPEDKISVVSKDWFIQCCALSRNSLMRIILHYADNDPLDYRDYTFLHRDGTPADYGDVFQLFATQIRSVEITTAGWYPEDKVASRAVSKIIEYCQGKEGLLRYLRISVSAYERTAVDDFEAYYLNIKRMLKVLAPLSPGVAIYYDLEGKMRKEDADSLGLELEKYMQEILPTKPQIECEQISRISGRSAQMLGQDPNDHDPYDAVGGYVISPNGEVLHKPDLVWVKQDKVDVREYNLVSPRGSIPEPTGLRLYDLKGG